MSEQNTNPTSAQEELIRRLKSIGADLWGGLPKSAAEAPETGEETGMEADIEKAWRKELTGKSESAARLKAMEQEAADRRKAQAPMKKTADRPEMTIENLWFTADETVDWTEALLRESPGDGLTGQKLWSFYHRMAGRVLAGETDAYAEVLTTLNPLGDLAEYVSGMILRTPGPDRVECAFECQPEDLERYGEKYLAALSLRIARDLLAVLPVSEVHVNGKLQGAEKVDVTFRREQLLKRKMAFLNPVDLIAECGGALNP